MERMAREKKEREWREEQDRRWRRRNVLWRRVGEDREEKRVLIKMYIEGAGKRSGNERRCGDKRRRWKDVGGCGNGGREGEEGVAGDGKRDMEEIENRCGGRSDVGGEEDKRENDGESKDGKGKREAHGSK